MYLNIKKQKVSAYPRRHSVLFKKDAWYIQHGINIYSKIISILYDYDQKLEVGGGNYSSTYIHEILSFISSANIIQNRNSHKENVNVLILVNWYYQQLKISKVDPIKYNLGLM